MPDIGGFQLTDYYQLTGGIDTISSAVALGTSKYRDAQNVNGFPLNGFSWRQGYTPLNSTAVSGPCTGLYMARFSSGTNTAFLVSDTKLYSMASLSGTWTDRTNSMTITTGKNNLWNFAMLNDIVIATNDTDTCLQIDNTLTTAVVAGSPSFTSALFPIEFYGYMFYWNTVESATRQPDRGRFSDINAPNAFTMVTTNNVIDVAKKQGGDVRGAVVYDGRQFVFKRHGIYAIDFQPTRVNSSGLVFPFTEAANPVVVGVGTQSHRSIVKFTTPITNTKQSGKELVFFVDQFGVPRLFDGSTTVQIGFSISKSRDTSILSLSDMDKTRIPQIFAVNYPERSQIHCWMTKDGSQHDTDWILDYSTGFAWYRNVYNDDFNVGALFEKTDGTFRMYMGDYNGKVYEYDTTQADNGVAISSYVIPGDAFNQSPVINSNWAHNEIRGATGSSTQLVTINYYADGEDSPSLTDSFSLTTAQSQWDDVTWDDFQWAASGLVTKTRVIGTDAKTLRAKLLNTTLNSTASIEGFTFFSRILGWKQS